MAKCKDCGCVVDDTGESICNECHIKRYRAPKPGAIVECRGCGKTWKWGAFGTTGKFHSEDDTIYCGNCEDRIRDRRQREEEEARQCQNAEDSLRESDDGNSSSFSNNSLNYSVCRTPSCSSASSDGGPVEVFLGILVLIAICWGGYRGYKWLTGGSDAVVSEKEIIEKWQEHIELRREAFSDGLSENEVETKGLRNFTWDEWLASHGEGLTNQTGKTNAEVIGDKAKSLWKSFTSKDDNVVDMHQKWVDYLNAKHSLGAKGMSEEDLHSAGFDELSYAEFKERFKDKAPPSEESVKAEMEKSRETIEENTPVRKASNTTSYKVSVSKDEATVTATSEYGTRSDAWQGAIRAAVKGAVAGFVGDLKRVEANKARFEARLNDVTKDDIYRYDTLMDMQKGEVFTVKIYARLRKETLAKKFKDIFPDCFGSDEVAQPNARNDVSFVPKSTIVVQGKGETREEALNHAFREAVRKSVITWVGSKKEILGNFQPFIDQVKTVTEADIAEYEILDTELGTEATIILKVKVSVSKKAIAPKMALVFPEVFGND